MQYINLNKTLELENKIQDLILISIDDQIDIIDDKDGVRISGKINVSGTAKTIEGNKDFLQIIDIDIFVTYEELVDRATLNVSVNDFNYKIEENKLLLDISLKIVGLKEIETTFLTQENNEILSEEEVDRESKKDESETKEEQVEDSNEKKVFIDEEIDTTKEESEFIEINKVIEDIEEHKEVREKKEEKEETKEIEQIEEIAENKKKSLLKSVFSNKRIKEDISWRLHCVRDETSYEQIAVKYNVNLNKLISINNNEKLEEDKLIFLPLD